MRSISKKGAKKRRELSKIRPEIIERDAERCLLCGNRFAEVHHINFRSQMGGNNKENLCCLCWDCHHNKAHGVESRMIRQKLETIMSERYNYEY